MPKVKMGDAIQSAMGSVPRVPGMASAAGKYNETPGLGPKGVDGGIPLKTVDEAIKTPQTVPVSTNMIITPAATK